ncbi:N-ethylmaleimide reductase [Abditibacteriota bacterium]|nr:N-ethylmaleimide reductase [Abditibacteriota bacterium]
MSNTLFSPLQLGALQLPNRIIMAPLTRCRADEGRVPSEEASIYYAQRATAGLILTEATSVTPMGVGYPDTPGVWSEEQIEGWRRVTDSVHEAGGRIFLQLWHVGRISHSSYLNGQLPVAPSAIPAQGRVSLVRPATNFEVPRALETDEIPGVVEAYRQGAENAKASGFDGVEIHGANGYLIDQFLQDSSNHRTDQYGGSIENRARLALEVTDAVISVWGADRVGYHIAPRGDSHTMGDSNLRETFGYLVSELSKRQIAFVFSRASREDATLTTELKNLFDGVWIANQQVSPEEGEQLIETGQADAVSWGKQFIANPDLVERLRLGAPLNEPNPDTFYTYPDGDKSVGYTDYPFLELVESTR